jgi:hypothetical protein
VRVIGRPPDTAAHLHIWDVDRLVLLGGVKSYFEPIGRKYCTEGARMLKDATVASGLE